MNAQPMKLAAAACAVALALGLSACGGDDAAPDAGATPSTTATAAPTPASDLPAATPAGAEQAAFFRSIADAQVDARTSHVSMRIKGAGQTISAEGDVSVGSTAADTAMTMSMDMGSASPGSISMTLVDQVLYMKAGQLTGDKYARISLDDASSPIAQQFGSITEQLDPTQQLDQFQQALTSMQKKGEPRTIDGVEAQPYELTLDTSKIDALTRSPAGAYVPATLTYTMYIGPDDLLRRVTASVADGTMTADYSRWGQKVDVKAPPADQIADRAPGGS
jgi:hypothetical protein